MKAIYLTDKDYRRLQSIVKAQRSANGPHVVADLGKKLKRAKIVPSAEIPVEVVTMNSTVRLKEVKSRGK
jgi:regulator of nucleoside diphosphate kinase